MTPSLRGRRLPAIDAAVGVVLALSGLGLATAHLPAHAQYPTIYSGVEEESKERKAAANRRSDAAWEKAQPVLKEWEAKGKPYIPWAKKPSDLPQADIPAFPGAQGGGMYTSGGRGGRVCVVTTLADRGPGSFREVCETAGPRVIVFNVAGIIHLSEPIRIRAPYVTIAGSTAPGDGVCIADCSVLVDTHDVIIRYMRFRRGSTWVGDRDDSLGGNPIGNVIVDHVSASWGLDENMSMYRHMYRPAPGAPEQKLPMVNLTFQNCISSESLNTYNHAFGSTIGGYNSTFYHCLWACNTGRNPSVGMIYDFTFANNVVYNWRHRTIDGGDQRSFYTIENNYFKPGPNTPKNEPIAYRILKPEARRGKEATHGVSDFGMAYVAGNVVEGNDAVTHDNWADGVQLGNASDKGTNLPNAPVLAAVRAESPYPYSYLEIQPAKDAYEYVLANAGATLPHRDAVDQRIIDEVRNGTVTYKKGNGVITDISQVGGYPAYEGTPYRDSDHDGIPDDWETEHGLNPKDPSDATALAANGSGYMNIEEFISGRDPRKPYPKAPAPHTYRDLWAGKTADDNTWNTAAVVHVNQPHPTSRKETNR